MSKYIVSIILSLFVAIQAPAEELKTQEEDKQLHMMASYSINSAFISVMPKRSKYKKIKAAAMTAAVGVAKELSDPKFSGADMAANGIGILASSVLYFVYEF